MKTRRVAVAGLFHETNTFVEQPTGLIHFNIRRGGELFSSRGDSSPVGGFLAQAEEFGWEVRPVADYRAMPSGMVDDEVVESFWKDFSVFIKSYVNEGLDALFLVLHGAMVSQSLKDVEGEILTRIRHIPGMEQLPIFGVFDLHANFTKRMADHSNGLVAYRENPHTDSFDAARVATRLLNRALEEGKTPVTYWKHPPLMWPPPCTATADEPMRSLEKMARELERENADFLAVNVIAGFSHADTPDTGVSFTIVSKGEVRAVEIALDKLCKTALETHDSGCPREWNLDEVLKKIPDHSGLTLLVEPADNIGGGAPGDDTTLLKALIEHNVKSAGVIINDAQAVRLLEQIREGSVVAMNIGGKGSSLGNGPLYIEVTLLRKQGGEFELEDKKSHLASMFGNKIDMGPCAVLKCEGVTILLTSRPTPPFDLGQWYSQGIDPKQFSVITIKAAVAHRQAYDPIASASYTIETSGPCATNLKRLPYHAIQRPIYPLDQIKEPIYAHAN